MRWLCFALAVLTLATVAYAEVAPATHSLAYRAIPGQTAVYRLTLRATGEQLSLGERRPVRFEAEYEVRERALSVEADGSFWLEASRRLLKVKDPAHLLNGNGEPTAPRIRLTSRGEVLELASPAATAGLRERAAAALLGQPQLVVLPATPVAAGAAWEWAKEGATQTNRLLAARDGVAEVTSRATRPVSLQDSSAALGLTTEVRGAVEQTSTLQLELATGRVRRQWGTMTLRTSTEIGLTAETGPRSFHAELRLRVTFDAKLLRVESASAEDRR